LGYSKSERSPNSNSRNGNGIKTITTDHYQITIETPRDRHSSFQPQLIQKGQHHFKGFDDKIISMYAKGMSMRDIQAHIEEM
jgi:putative transposase